MQSRCTTLRGRTTLLFIKNFIMLTVYFLLILYYSSPAAFSPAEPDGIFVFIVGGWSSSIIIDMLLFVLLFVLLVLYLHNIFF